MSKKQKAGLTRRLQRQYHATIGGRGGVYLSAYAWRIGPGWMQRNSALAALGFAKNFGGREGVDRKRLQRVILASEDPAVVYRFAAEVEWANVKRCQRRVIELGDPALMRTFAANVPGAEVWRLEAYALIAEVMGR